MFGWLATIAAALAAGLAALRDRCRPVRGRSGWAPCDRRGVGHRNRPRQAQGGPVRAVSESTGAGANGSACSRLATTRLSTPRPTASAADAACGGTAAVRDWLLGLALGSAMNQHRQQPFTCENLEPPVGIEPTTYSLRAHFDMPVIWAHTPVTCIPASTDVHQRLTEAGAVVTQLVTHWRAQLAAGSTGSRVRLPHPSIPATSRYV